MIDKNGKVFGKINIIDLIVILVIVAAIAMFGVSRLSNRGDDGVAIPEGQSAYMVFYAEEVPDFVVDKLEKGAKVYDVDMKAELGEVVSFESAPSVSYASNSDGEYVLTTREKYNSVKITAKVNGTPTEYGIAINDNQYGVGHSLTIRAGHAKIYLKIFDVYIK